MANNSSGLVKGVVALAALAAAGLYGVNYLLTKDLKLPPYQPVEVHWTDQNWKPADWDWFYHASQGTSFELPVPYSWFMALEQPRIALGEIPLLTAPDYIQRFGFLPSEKGPSNPDGLPVGFARDSQFHDPVSGKTKDVIGFTCAACHTGQVNYQGKGIRIEGGPAMAHMGKFRTAVGVSMLITRYDPLRFDRFARRVLGEGAGAEQKAELKQQLDELVKQGKAQKDLESARKLYPVDEGFARLDALGRIGNYVFGTEISQANLLPATAPVNFPHIWNSSWYDWVQYNASIKQPMTRNAGEAMGVFARVNFDQNSPRLFDSTINVDNLYAIEMRLRGDNVFSANEPPRFKGLDAPKWPEEVLGKIDRAKAERGKQLYAQHCQGCHLPPPNTPEFFDAKYWTEQDGYGFKYLKLRVKNLADIGTDGNTAMNWWNAVVNLGPLGEKLKADINQRLDPFVGYGSGGAITPAGVALPLLVQKSVERRYEQQGIPRERWAELDGYRPNEVRAPLGYKARPLNGMWATAPFLHNGSVPNVYQLLLPVAQRDKAFYLGSKEYDPVHLGYSTAPLEGGFKLDTSLSGNRNTGHEFKGGPDSWRSGEPGVIGPELTDDERYALIEFLKTL